MNFFKRKSQKLNLDDIAELQNLSGRWNISLNDLSRAIVETGSIDIKFLKSYIKNCSKNKNCGNIWIYQGMRIIR